MPDDNSGVVKVLISKGAELVGAAAGSALGFYAAGPGGAVAGALGGTILKQMLEMGGDICHRMLSPREVMRVGAAYAIAGAAIKERLDQGEKPRDDGFFTPDSTNRSAAEELLEGVLLKCKNDHEERKLNYLGRIFANAVFTDVAAADANAVLTIAERLTFRQLQVLAAFSGVGQFTAILGRHGYQELTDGLRASGDVFLADDFVQLCETHRLIGGKGYPRVNPPVPHDRIELTPIGLLSAQLMAIETMPPEELAHIDTAAEAALKDR